MHSHVFACIRMYSHAFAYMNIYMCVCVYSHACIRMYSDVFACIVMYRKIRFGPCIQYMYRGARSIHVFGIGELHEIHARCKGKNGGGARHTHAQKWAIHDDTLPQSAHAASAWLSPSRPSLLATPNLGTGSQCMWSSLKCIG